MGYIEKLERLEAEERQKQQATTAQASVEPEEREAANKALEVEKSQAPNDNLAIITLLDNLPTINFSRLLEAIKRVEGYGSSVTLYTRLALCSTKEQQELLQQQGLDEKLQEKGIGIKRYAVHDHSAGFTAGDSEPTDVLWENEHFGLVHPTKMFFGDDVKPRHLFWSIREPQEPGIGVRFSRGRDGYSEYAYVRLLAPSTAVFTGTGSRIEIANARDFDNEIERVLKQSTHTQRYKRYKRVKNNKSPFGMGGVVGNG